MAFYWLQICEYELKTIPFSLELFFFFKQLAGLIEEHLDVGSTTDRQVLKSTYLHMSLPKISKLVEPKRKKFALCHQTALKHFVIDVVFLYLRMRRLVYEVSATV